MCVSICPQAPDNKVPLPAKPSSLTPPNPGHRPASPSSSSGLSPSPELRHSPLTPPTLEELRNQLRDLRASIELLKSQHRYITPTVSTSVCVCGCIRVMMVICLNVFVYFRQEMKQLASALDDEKKIRISLQVRLIKGWRPGEFNPDYIKAGSEINGNKWINKQN